MADYSVTSWLTSRATKSQLSQDFSAVLKLHETSTNQISHSYHEWIPRYWSEKVKIYHLVKIYR